MNRKYTSKHYLTLIEKIKKQIPDVMLSTDIIVGFPGETKKDFLKTADIFKKVKYTMAYIARYSARKGTASYKLENNISPEEKAKRENILTDILKQTALENNENFIGKTVRVLIDKKIANGYIGKTAQFVNVKIPLSANTADRYSPLQTEEIKIGQFVNVKITKADFFGMEGENL